MSSQALSAPPTSVPVVSSPVARDHLTRRKRPFVALSILALVLLGGCGTQRTPDSYTGSVQKNFLQSCETEGKSGGLSNSKETCACSYAQIKKSIPFSRFKKINSTLSEKPAPLPAELVTIVDGCKAGETGTGATQSSASSTTTTR